MHGRCQSQSRNKKNPQDCSRGFRCPEGRSYYLAALAAVSALAFLACFLTVFFEVLVAFLVESAGAAAMVETAKAERTRAARIFFMVFSFG